jgi:hypothetical protein
MIKTVDEAPLHHLWWQLFLDIGNSLLGGSMTLPHGAVSTQRGGPHQTDLDVFGDNAFVGALVAGRLCREYR